MADGWIKKYRKALDTPELCTFVRRGVWDYLLLRAAHKPTHVVFRGKPVRLERGQLAVSIRSLAEQGEVSHKQLRNILSDFESAKMIKMGTAQGKPFTIITINKFNEFQSAEEPAGHSAGHSRGTVGAQSGHSEQEREESKESITYIGNSLKSQNNGAAQAEYAFQGAIIRLNQKDFDAWTKAYHSLDIRAELQSLDDFYDRNLRGSERPKWFQRCSAALAKKHERALAQGVTKRRRRQATAILDDLSRAGDDEQ